jgi:hypothetical protein
MEDRERKRNLESREYSEETQTRRPRVEQPVESITVVRFHVIEYWTVSYL